MDLFANPFHILGATARDQRQRLMTLAEEKSLFNEEDTASEACSILTTPRKRLTAELAWLPGLGPNRIVEAIGWLQNQPLSVRKKAASLPPLARVNLLATALPRVTDSLSVDQVVDWIIELALTFDDLDAEQLINLINEERTISRFQAVADVQSVVSGIQERRWFFRDAIKQGLDTLPASQLVQVVTQAVDESTDQGISPAPVLISDLVDSFELAATEFLEQETETINRLISKISNSVSEEQDTADLDYRINQLENVVRNWYFVARPIQLIYYSRGRHHQPSIEVAAQLRSLAVRLFNEHDRLELSRRLTSLIQEVFAEVEQVAEQAAEDSDALDEIAEKREATLRQLQAQTERWRQDITYETEWGMIVKKRIRISPEGIEWKGRRWRLEDTTHVRWGGIRHSVNGVPTGTKYSIYVGNDNDSLSIDLTNNHVYSELLDRLWKAVGVRLLTEFLENLRDGKQYQFGNALVTDTAIRLKRHRMFSEDDIQWCKWHDVVIGSEAGNLVIAKRSDRKVYVSLSYLDVNNTHILEATISILFKNSNERLSDLLKN